MPRNINDIHLLIDDIVRKQRGVYIPPARKDRALHTAQMDIFNEYLSVYISTNVLPDALITFKTN